MTQPRLLSSSGDRGWIFLTFTGDPGTVNHNANRRGSHWSEDRKHKLQWEGVYLTGFMMERLPKGLANVKVWATFQFTDPGRRRDPENFRGSFSKPFADALVKAGYLDDDTEPYYELVKVQISDQKLTVTPAQKTMGVRSCTHVAVLYRVAP